MKKLVVDIDHTLCVAADKDYANAKPIRSVIEKVNDLHRNGWYIILFTSRNMNSYNNNVGMINARTLPVIIDWLDRHSVSYHEIHVGKPWAKDGFYVDDRAIRPREFVTNTIEQLEDICRNDLTFE
jgi:capsule biosynthesis phosphatase